MSDPTPPPPLPPESPYEPPGAPPASPGNGKAGKSYDYYADKIGGVPNIRKRDNLFQGVFVLISGGVGATVGNWVVPSSDNPMQGLLTGLIAGLVVGVVLSGIVLMVLGMIRKS